MFLRVGEEDPTLGQGGLRYRYFKIRFSQDCNYLSLNSPKLETALAVKHHLFADERPRSVFSRLFRLQVLSRCTRKRQLGEVSVEE